MPIKGTYKSTLRCVGAKGGTVTTDVEIIAGVKFSLMVPADTPEEYVSVQDETVTSTCAVNGGDTVLTLEAAPSHQTFAFEINTSLSNIFHVRCRNRIWNYLDFWSTVKVLLNECGCSSQITEAAMRVLRAKMNFGNISEADVLRNKNNALTSTIKYTFYGTSEVQGYVPTRDTHTYFLKDTRSYVVKQRDAYTLYLYRGDVTDVCVTADMAKFKLNDVYVGIACASFSWNFTHYILTVSPEDLDIVSGRFIKKYSSKRPDMSQQRFNKMCRFECRPANRVTYPVPSTTRDIIQETQGDGFMSKYMCNVTSPVHVFSESLQFYPGVGKSLKLTLEKEDYFDSSYKVHLHGFRGGCCGWIYSTRAMKKLLEDCGVAENGSLILFSECAEYSVLPPEYLFE